MASYADWDRPAYARPSLDALKPPWKVVASTAPDDRRSFRARQVQVEIVPKHPTQAEKPLRGSGFTGVVPCWFGGRTIVRCSLVVVFLHR